VLCLRPFELVPAEPSDEQVVLGVCAFEVDGTAVIVPDQAQYRSGFPPTPGGADGQVDRAERAPPPDFHLNSRAPRAPKTMIMPTSTTVGRT
jgi:hypothetical protein